MSGAERLRQLLAGEELIVAPGVYDGISAAAASRFGFRSAYMTGAGVSASAYGLPDVGLVTQTEMVERARVIAGLLEVPLIADADTGYGSPVNVVRTVHEYERAGVAAIQLEDQVFPKRCGHLAGKEVVAAERFVAVLRAAAEARRDPATVIVARTDARAPLGIDEAIRRGRLYREAGADVIFIEAPRSEAEVERVAAEVEAPLLLNLVPGGLTPEMPADRLRELGYRIVIRPGTALARVVPATLEAFGELAESARVDRVDTDGPQAFFDLFGLQGWDELGRRYEGYEKEEEPRP
jgi:2-methylisocitrate lyase-like PEP mutase family enzyme